MSRRGTKNCFFPSKTKELLVWRWKLNRKIVEKAGVLAGCFSASFVPSVVLAVFDKSDKKLNHQTLMISMANSGCCQKTTLIVLLTMTYQCVSSLWNCGTTSFHRHKSPLKAHCPTFSISPLSPKFPLQNKTWAHTQKVTLLGTLVSGFWHNRHLLFW